MPKTKAKKAKRAAGTNDTPRIKFTWFSQSGSGQTALTKTARICEVGIWGEEGRASVLTPTRSASICQCLGCGR